MLGLSRKLMDRMPALEIIAVNGIGTDAVDRDEARRRGVRVTTTPDVLTDDVADMAMALLLAAFRRLCEGDRFIRAGRWPAAGLPVARRVTGKRLGILGLGRIGRAIARRAEAFAMPVSYTDLRAAEDVSYRFVPDLVDLARDVDALVVAASGGARSKLGARLSTGRRSIGRSRTGRIYQRTKCACGAMEYGAGCPAATSCQCNIGDPRRHGRFAGVQFGRTFRRPSAARRGGLTLTPVANRRRGSDINEFWEYQVSKSLEGWIVLSLSPNQV